DAIGTDEAKALKGRSALANARLAYQAYEKVFGSLDGSRTHGPAPEGRPARHPVPAVTLDAWQSSMYPKS
ncbi:hypothetical protein CLM82_24830, partial [Streptomyces albidoflavus]